MAKQELNWEDFDALAAWIAEEIGGMYFMDKKAYRNQPQHLHQFSYRVSIKLFHEERVILALFIKCIFRAYWESGKTSDFNWRSIFSSITRELGMSDYYGTSLRTACWQFTKNFPDFIRIIETEMSGIVAI